MDYISYKKQELDKILFMEIGRDLILKDEIKIKKGEYPIHSNDLVNIAKNSAMDIPLNYIINGMIYVIACDAKFKYNDEYRRILMSIKGIESYLIMNIERDKGSDTNRALIFSNVLCDLYPKKEYLYNRVVLLIKLYEETNFDFFVDEIISSLESITVEYLDFAMPHYQLGCYYMKKDIDKAKYHFRRCSEDNRVRDQAAKYIEEIEAVEKYDQAVEAVNRGEGKDVINILVSYLANNPDDPNAMYYTALALRQGGYNEKALVYLSDLIEYGETANVLSEIALNLAALSQFEAALEYFEKALKIDKNNEVILSNIGVCYLNLNMFDEALKKFEYVLSINPNDEIAKEWCEKLKALI